MKDTGSPNNSWQVKILWLSVVTAASVAVLLALAEVLSLANSVSRIGVLLASVFVGILVSRYEPRIPGTTIKFSPKDVLAFWGVIWLGISGVVLLSTSA